MRQGPIGCGLPQPRFRQPQRYLYEVVDLVKSADVQKAWPKRGAGHPNKGTCGVRRKYNLVPISHFRCDVNKATLWTDPHCMMKRLQKKSRKQDHLPPVNPFTAVSSHMVVHIWIAVVKQAAGGWLHLHAPRRSKSLILAEATKMRVGQKWGYRLAQTYLKR
jgi:hypothetical protein